MPSCYAIRLVLALMTINGGAVLASKLFWVKEAVAQERQEQSAAAEALGYALHSSPPQAEATR